MPWDLEEKLGIMMMSRQVGKLRREWKLIFKMNHPGAGAGSGRDQEYHNLRPTQAKS
jgi:hypothetical protein